VVGRGKLTVVDRIDTRGVLPKEQRTTQEKSPQHLFVVHNSFEWLPETKANFGALLLDRVVDGHDFFLHVDVGTVELTDPGEICDAIFASAARKEPSRRLLKKESTEEEKTGRNKLDSEWLLTQNVRNNYLG
jgi:hypothetical protein